MWTLLVLIHLAMVTVVCSYTDWVQTSSPAGGMQWTHGASDSTETQFRITSPTEADGIYPDSIHYVQWNTYPRSGGSSPTDVRVTLLCAPYAYGVWKEEMDMVSVLAHSVPNTGSWLWIPRVPRAWSPDDYYAIQLCSLEDDHECSTSPLFRIHNPYSFYP